DVDAFAQHVPTYPSAAIPSSTKADEEISAPAVKSHPVEKAPTGEHDTNKIIGASVDRSGPKVTKYVRVPIKAKVKIKEFGEYDVLNISISGLFLKSNN